MKILLIEDNPGDARLVREVLKGAGGDFTISVAEKLGLGLKFLASRDVDAALLDLGLPDSHGLETLTKVRTQFPSLPVVIMTGSGDEALGVQAVQLGAQDYLVKGQIDSGVLRRALLYAVERKRAETELEASRKFLEIANRHSDLNPLLQEFVMEMKEFTNCEAVGIRLLDGHGNIPYTAYLGFSQEFYETESPLSIKTDRCMCINVVKGTTDSRLSFYTEGGSFYMNGTTRFLATVSEQDKGQTRNICNQAGYESVALLPIRVGTRIMGLIHLADRKENMVPLNMVKLLEQVASALGAGIQRALAEEALRRAKDELEERVSERTAELKVEIAERKRAQEEMQIRASQQTVVAQLGQRALAGCSLDTLLQEAVKQVAQTLGVEYCKVLELLPGGRELLLRAGVGWEKGLVGNVMVGMGIDSQAGYTLLSDKPVIVEDLRTEKRFTGPPLLHEHGVVSGMSVIIQGQDRPFGVLGAHTTRRVKFTEDDIHFLQAVANVLAATIERKQAEEQLRESEKKLRYLSSELISAQEKERKRIAGELHDSIAASLSAIKLGIENIVSQMEQDERRHSLREVISRVQQVNEETRRIMSDLRPSILDDLGIVPAIDWFCREFVEIYSTVSIEKKIGIEENAVPDSLRTPIFRICQEALNNVAKHSKATSVNLSLQKLDNRIQLDIGDNGKGFDLHEKGPEEHSRKGLGLVSMRERAEFSGGCFNVESNKGKGTVVCVWWPLK